MRRFPALLRPLGTALLFAGLSFHALSVAHAADSSSLQSQLSSQDAAIAQLNAEIAHYQAQIQQAEGDKKTLQSAISSLNLQLSEVKAQASVTQHQIAITQLRIQQLGTGIDNAQQAIETEQAGLAEDMRSLQQADDQPLVLQLMSADSLAEAWSDASQVLQVQNGIQAQIRALGTQKDSLATAQAASVAQKQNLTSQQKTLSTQQKSITQTASSKSHLLVQTKNSEATYQKLLAQAQAELASYSTFTQNAGGSGILTNQTSCDSWGCYYNQRDSQWGNMLLSGSSDRLAADGCLVTSMAMVMTHYGYPGVTPVTINANPENFSVGGLLLYTISVDGVSATRKTATIDATLATGNPVVVGLHAYGGTHYVVLTSGSRGNYLMRDPYVPNAKDVSFSAHYAVRNIFGISKVVIAS